MSFRVQMLKMSSIVDKLTKGEADEELLEIVCGAHQESLNVHEYAKFSRDQAEFYKRQYTLLAEACPKDVVDKVESRTPALKRAFFKQTCKVSIDAKFIDDLDANLHQVDDEELPYMHAAWQAPVVVSMDKFKSRCRERAQLSATMKRIGMILLEDYGIMNFSDGLAPSWGRDALYLQHFVHDELASIAHVMDHRVHRRDRQIYLMDSQGQATTWLSPSHWEYKAPDTPPVCEVEPDSIDDPLTLPPRQVAFARLIAEKVARVMWKNKSKSTITDCVAEALETAGHANKLSDDKRTIILSSEETMFRFAEVTVTWLNRRMQVDFLGNLNGVEGRKHFSFNAQTKADFLRRIVLLYEQYFMGSDCEMSLLIQGKKV